MGIMAALATNDEIELKAALDREGLLMAVRHRMVCDGSGDVLDVRDAVALSVRRYDPKTGKVSNTLMAFTSRYWTDNGPAILARASEHGMTVEITHGADYTAAGKLRREAYARLKEAAQTVE